MVWPNTQMPVLVEMYTGTEWVDITSQVRTREGITIRRGFPNEGRSAEPSSISMLLDNRTGNLSPRNPTGTYYGLIGRNTPVRVTLQESVAGPSYLDILTTSSSANVFGSITADHASLDITGDIDARFDGALIGWQDGAAVMGKYTTASDQRSWALLADAAGTLTFSWSTDGTSGGVLSATSTASAGLVSGERKAIRATLDVDNGAAGHTVTFYTSDTISGTWTQLGSAVTTAGTTSIYASTAVTEVGRVQAFTTLLRMGRVYAAQVRDGIGGTIVANPDYTSLTAGTTSFVDSAGRTWGGQSDSDSLVLGEASLRSVADPGVRALGEVSEWPSRWDVSGQDVTVPTVAQGVLRRLGQGQRAVRSPARAVIMLDVEGFFAQLGQEVVGYWPMEDAGGTSFASAVLDGKPMTYTGTAPEFASSGAFLGSDAVAVLAATTALSGELATGTDGSFQCLILLDVPASSGWADNTPLFQAQMDPTSSIGIWEVRYKTGGSLQVRALDHYGVEIAASGTLAFDVDGKSLWLMLLVGGSNVWQLFDCYLDADGEPAFDITTSSFTAGAIGHPVRYRIAPSGGLDGLGVGHAAAGDLYYSIPYSSSANYLLPYAAKQWRGEHAGWRAWRLLTEVGITATMAGVDEYTSYGVTYNVDDGTVTMGAQAVGSASSASASQVDARNEATFANLFAETIAAEHALVYETRNTLGVTFRPLHTLYNQAAGLTLDYEAAGEVAPDLEPVDDDQNVVNDVEVRRKDGSFARAVDEGLPTGSRVGTASPPDGVGQYQTSLEINIDSDDDLKHHAGWRLHIGTWDEQRYPTVRIDMLALAAQGKTSLIAQAAQLDVGDRLVLQNLPTWVSPDDADLLCLGFTERIGAFEWTIEVNCVPYGPYAVGVLGEALEGLDLPGTSGAYASTPDTAALDITGDIDIRVNVALDDWDTGAEQALVAKYTTTGNQRSYRLMISTAGNLELRWSVDGAATTSATCTVTPASVFTAGQRVSIRVTLDVDDGGGNRVTTFYSSTDTDLSTATWTQLGSTVTAAGTTSIFSGTATANVGAYSDGTAGPAAGTFYAAQVRSSIAGTVVANPDFSVQAAGTTSFADSAGRTWTVNGSAAITQPDYSDVQRLAGDSTCALRVAVDSDDTSFVIDPNVTRFTTAPAHFPFDLVIGGERVTATAASTTAATYVAAGAVSHADNAAVTPALYAGNATNDTIFVVGRFFSTSGELSITTGYDLVEQKDNLYLWRKVHDGSESNPTVTPSGGVAGDTVSAVTFGFANMPTTVDTASDLVVRSESQSNSTAAQNIAYPWLNYPKTTGCVVLLIAGKSDNWTSVAPPTGFTEAVDASTTTGSDQGLYVAYQIQTTAALVDAGSLVVTGGAAAISESMLLAIAAGYQTLTVTRSINSVSKAHAVGATVAVRRPLTLAL